MTDLQINTNTAHDNNPVHEAVMFYWGERCPEHEDGCPTCEAWKQYDNMFGESRMTEIDMNDPRVMMHEAAHAFYAWEKGRYNGNSPLSDDDRLTWMQGYVYAHTQKEWAWHEAKAKEYDAC